MIVCGILKSLLGLFIDNNSVSFKLAYRLNDNNKCTNLGHGINLQLQTLVCGLESLQTV